MKKLIIGCSILFVLSLGLAGTWYYKKVSSQLKLEDYVSIGERLIDEGNIPSAYGHYNEASLKDPTNVELNELSARLAFLLGRDVDVKFHAREAFKNGSQNIEIYQMLTEVEKKDGSFDLDKSLKILRDFPSSYERNSFIAKLKSTNSQYEGSQVIWNKLYEDQPSEELANNILFVYLNTQKSKQAVEFSKQFKKDGTLGKYGALLTYHAMLSEMKLSEIDEYLNTARREELFSNVLSFEYAKFLFARGEFEKSLSYFKELVLDEALQNEDIRNYVFFIHKLKKKPELKYEFLYSKLNPEIQAKVNRYRIVDSIKSKDVEELLNDLNRILKVADLKEEWAKVSGETQDFRSNREWLDVVYVEFVNSYSDNRIRKEASLYQMMIENIAKVNNSQDQMAKSEGIDAEVRKFFKQSLEVTDDSEASLEWIDKALTLLPRHPILMMQKARLLTLLKRYPEASDTYRTIIENARVYLYSNFFNCEWARTLFLSGKPLDASIVLKDLHDRGVYSDLSLKLYRDISLQLGDVDMASQSQKIIKEKLNDVDASSWGDAVVAMGEGEYKKALGLIQLLKEKFPKEKQYELAYLSTLYYDEQYTKVLEACEQSFLEKKETILLRTKSLQSLGKVKDAIAVYDSIPLTDLNDEQLNHFGELHNLDNNYDSAIKLYQQLLTRQKNHELGLLGIVGTYLELNQLDKAQEYLEQYMGLNLPENTRSLFFRAQLHDRLGQDRESLSLSQQVLIIDDTHLPARMMSGISHYKLGEFEKGLKELLKVKKELTDNKQLDFYLMLSYFETQDYQKSLVMVDELLASAPGNFGLTQTKVKIHLALEQLEAAQAVFASIKNKDEDVDYNIVKAELLVAQGQKDKAIKLLVQKLKYTDLAYLWSELTIDNLQSDRIDWIQKIEKSEFNLEQWFALGQRAEAKSFYLNGINLYSLGLKLEPQNPFLLNNFAWSKFKAGQLDEKAISSSKRSLELSPQNINFLDTYVEILFGLEKYVDAMTLMETKVDLIGGNPHLLHKMGICYEKGFEIQKALQFYSNAYTLISRKDKELAPLKELLDKKIKELNGI